MYLAATSACLGAFDPRDGNPAQELAPFTDTKKAFDRRQRKDSSADSTAKGTPHMSSSIGPTTIAALRHAQRRLLDARPKSSDGRLTVANLAREAGVSRATAYRAGAIVTEFRSMVSERRGRPPYRVRTLRDNIAALEEQIATLKRGERKELLDLRLTIEAMAHHVQALTLLTIEQRRRIARFDKSSDSCKNAVTPSHRFQRDR
jgi:hypothetical protein